MHLLSVCALLFPPPPVRHSNLSAAHMNCYGDAMEIYRPFQRRKIKFLALSS
jgi:hypothetical protein